MSVQAVGASSFSRYVDKIAKQIAGTVSDILGKKDEKKSQDGKLPQHVCCWTAAGAVLEVQDNRDPARRQGKVTHLLQTGACRASNCDTFGCLQVQKLGISQQLA